MAGRGRCRAPQPAGAFLVAQLAASRPRRRKLRRFIEIEPVLDFNVQPGFAATQAITDAAQRHNLACEDQARVSDRARADERRRIRRCRDHAALNARCRSSPSDHPVAGDALLPDHPRRDHQHSLRVAYSAALGLFLVGAEPDLGGVFVLFVGLGIDSASSSASACAERHELGALEPALISAARKARRWR
jgi:hypothetical protein